jgi:hypothetical protein
MALHMKWKRYVLSGLLLLQIPFVYKVCQTRQLDAFLAELEPQTVELSPFQDLRGSLHVHSAAGSHTIGTYPEIIRAAKEADYEYLFITEHPKKYELFNRLEDPDLILVYGWEEEREDGGRNLRSDNSEVKIFSLFEGPPVPEDVTGIEVFNIGQNAKAANNIFGWVNWLYHKVTYPELFFFQIWELNQSHLDLWDQTAMSHRISAVAGNNAHQNVGIVLMTTSGDRLFSLMVDPYLLSLKFVTNHVLLPYETEPGVESVLEALRTGSSYIAFEQIADPTGFSFHARVGERSLPMGTEVPVGTELVFQSPVPALFRLLREGTLIAELEGVRFTVDTELPGPHRVEVYPLDPPRLLEGKPWIISNPIYVQ